MLWQITVFEQVPTERTIRRKGSSRKSRKKGHRAARIPTSLVPATKVTQNGPLSKPLYRADSDSLLSVLFGRLSCAAN